MYNGTVIFFSPKSGYGFITYKIDGIVQKDIFCHFSDIDMEGFRTLLPNQNVSFNIGTNHHGQPKAINVTVI